MQVNQSHIKTKSNVKAENTLYICQWWRYHATIRKFEML